MRTTWRGCRSARSCRWRATANCRSAPRRRSARPPTCWPRPACRLSGKPRSPLAPARAIGAEWTASGEFELRLSKPAAATLQLAFYRRRGRSLSVTAKAIAGVEATFRGKDLLATLMRAISPDPEADLNALIDGGLDDAAIGAIQQAIAASLDRSLSLSAQLQVSALREDAGAVRLRHRPCRARCAPAGRQSAKRCTAGCRQSGEAASESGAIRLVASAASLLRAAQDIMAHQSARYRERGELRRAGAGRAA